MSSKKKIVNGSTSRPSRRGEREAHRSAVRARRASTTCTTSPGPMSPPRGASAFFAEVFGAFPDFAFAVARPRRPGRPRGGALEGHGRRSPGRGPSRASRPTARASAIEGADVAPGARRPDRPQRRLPQRGWTCCASSARSPAAGSAAEQRMKTSLLNARNRLTGGDRRPSPEEIADGVWIMRGGFPAKTMNVYFVRDGSGVLAVRRGHRGDDERGGRRGRGAGRHHARRCSATATPTTAGSLRGSTGRRLLPRRRGRRRRGRRRQPLLPPRPALLVRQAAVPRAAQGSGTAGPCRSRARWPRATTSPASRWSTPHGHAPGLIALWRASDRLALVSDCFYTLDPQTGRPRPPARAPSPPSTSTPSRRAPRSASSPRMEPAAAWAGHAEPLTGDVRGQLERAADTT